MTATDHRVNIEERGGQEPDQLICGECRSEFRQISEFIHHKAEHTTGAGSYLCELCGRCFLSGTVLAYHYSSTHKLQPAGSPLHNPPRCEDVVATQDAASENGCLGLLLVLEPETRVPLDNQDGKCVDIDSVAVPDSGVLPRCFRSTVYCRGTARPTGPGGTSCVSAAERHLPPGAGW